MLLLLLLFFIFILLLLLLLLLFFILMVWALFPNHKKLFDKQRSNQCSLIVVSRHHVRQQALGSSVIEPDWTLNVVRFNLREKDDQYEHLMPSKKSRQRKPIFVQHNRTPTVALGVAEYNCIWAFNSNTSVVLSVHVHVCKKFTSQDLIEFTSHCCDECRKQPMQCRSQ